jgi:signal transduction histidine kinase/ActR/RegA family two-component response regulator
VRPGRRQPPPRPRAIIAAQNIIAADFRRERVIELMVQQACLLAGATGASVELGRAAIPPAAGGAPAASGTAGVEPATGTLAADGVTVHGDEVPIELFRRFAARSLAVVPLVCLGRRLGELRVFDHRPRRFSAKAMGDLQLLAGFAAVALSHAAELEAKEAVLLDLRRAKEAADAASHAKSEFLASMSHELRTPLNSVIGFSEILRDQRFGPLNQRQARHVENVLTSGRHLLQLVNDVLDLSKVESGRMDLLLVPIDLRETLGEAVAIVQALAEAKQVEIEVSLPAARPALVADQGKLKQVLYNLLTNAVKFTPSGGRVRVEAQALATPAGAAAAGPGMLQVAVADTGTGIPLKDQLRIFEAFEQAESPLSRINTGTGLGLALTRRLVELHGGRIWVESSGTGKGSCFRFTLPLALGEPAAEAAARPRQHLPARVVQRTAPRVLVVDDEPDAREIIRLCLMHAGFDVVEAEDGEQALAAARRLRPQAITLDILMPGREGWQVLAALRENPTTRDIPVIVVSVAEEGILAESLGAQAYLGKPIDRELLSAVVRELVGLEVEEA